MTGNQGLIRIRMLIGLLVCILSFTFNSGIQLHQDDSTGSKEKVVASTKAFDIPVANLFGNPKPEASGTGEVVPYFPSYLYTRKSRFFEKSSKPDTPVRLITKKTKL